MAGFELPEWLLKLSSLIGTLWLRALQMTIIPLVATLLVIGLAQMVNAARAGVAAQRFLALVFAVNLIVVVIQDALPLEYLLWCTASHG